MTHYAWVLLLQGRHCTHLHVDYQVQLYFSFQDHKKVSTSTFPSLTLKSPTISVLKLAFSDVTQTSPLLPSRIWRSGVPARREWSDADAAICCLFSVEGKWGSLVRALMQDDDRLPIGGALSCYRLEEASWRHRKSPQDPSPAPPSTQWTNRDSLR